MAIRDPRDAALSWYRFFEGWFFETGSIDSALFSDQLCDDFQRVWNETIAADFGIADYEALLASIS